MRFLAILLLFPALVPAQKDPAFEARKAWDAEHCQLDYKARASSLFEVSAEWVAKWPDSRLAWEYRRESLLSTRSRSAELWKQVDENLIRLSPPHTFASLAAYDWVTAQVNLKDAETLLTSEIEWEDAQRPPEIPSTPTLADMVDRAEFSSRSFGSLCSLASAQIQLKEFDRARTTIGRIRGWLDGDFKRYYDQDPLETVPDNESHYFQLSAQLAQAEGRKMDALAFYQHVITNPYHHREYGGGVNETHALWQEMGGTDEGWMIFSRVPGLPAGVPSGHPGTPFLPWVALDYRLPEMSLPGLDSRTWTIKDFEGKSTVVYLWGSSCPLSGLVLPAIQALYNMIEDRHDIQLVALSRDDDPQRLSALMKASRYTFPVLVGKSYAEKLVPKMKFGEVLLVDKTGSVRLERSADPNIVGRQQAFVDEVVYKATQVSRDGLPASER